MVFGENLKHVQTSERIILILPIRDINTTFMHRTKGMENTQYNFPEHVLTRVDIDPKCRQLHGHLEEANHEKKRRTMNYFFFDFFIPVTDHVTDPNFIPQG